MSDSNGPVRRRRIAGEGGPAAPAKKTAAKKTAAKKVAAKKAPLKKAPAKDAPAKKVAATKAPLSAPATAKSSAKTSAATGLPVKKATPATRPKPVSRPVAPQVPSRKPSDSAEKEPGAAREPGSRPSRRDLLWLVPATLVTAAVLVLGVFWVVSPPGSSDSGSGLDSSRRQASSAAASAAETIFSFRFDQLDQHLKASKALMTPAFGKEFDKIAPALTELAPQRNIVVQAVARESAALPCGDECSSTKADVLVFVDQARLVGDSTTPTVFANRIKVSMVKGDDGWLVSNIRAL